MNQILRPFIPPPPLQNNLKDSSVKGRGLRNRLVDYIPGKFINFHPAMFKDS